MNTPKLNSLQTDFADIPYFVQKYPLAESHVRAVFNYLQIICFDSRVVE